MGHNVIYVATFYICVLALIVILYSVGPKVSFQWRPPTAVRSSTGRMSPNIHHTLKCVHEDGSAKLHWLIEFHRFDRIEEKKVKLRSSRVRTYNNDDVWAHLLHISSWLRANTYGLSALYFHLSAVCLTWISLQTFNQCCHHQCEEAQHECSWASCPLHVPTNTVTPKSSANKKPW